MIRVIIEHKTNNIEKLVAALLITRNEAMKQRGYITGETLVNTDDPSNILVISTWETLDYWKVWDTSETRTAMKVNINNLLTEPYTVRTFEYYFIKDKRVFSSF
jgi:heme oxygenase (mycobilin-producing)